MSSERKNIFNSVHQKVGFVSSMGCYIFKLEISFNSQLMYLHLDILFLRHGFQDGLDLLRHRGQHELKLIFGSDHFNSLITKMF